MRYLLLLLFTFGLQLAFAQTPAVAPPADMSKYTLEQRFQAMKAKAESYQDYKVIKATTLDSEWKVFMDSIRANKAIWHEAKGSIAAQQTELKNSQAALAQKEASMTDITYDSTHISFLGIPFSKKTFIVLVMALVAGLAVVVLFLSGRLKMMHSTVKEKTDLAEVTVREYEDYKHKALDKQTKLSRELQNERNKLSELRHN